MARDEPHQMRIRIPKELHEELEQEASRKSISINSEVIHRLIKAKFDDQKEDIRSTISRAELRSLLSHIKILVAAVKLFRSYEIEDVLMSPTTNQVIDNMVNEISMDVDEISKQWKISWMSAGFSDAMIALTSDVDSGPKEE